MSKIFDVHSIIVPAQNANLSAHTYTEIYGGSAGCTMMLNDTVGVAVGAGSSFNINIRTISGGTGCFLLGDNKNVSQGSQILG